MNGGGGAGASARGSSAPLMRRRRLAASPPAPPPPPPFSPTLGVAWLRPHPHIPPPCNTTTHTPPVTPTEELLATIYAQVLGLDRVGTHDSFFDLGGDSILSMQVVAHARTAGLVCRPRDVFVEQTVAALARVVTVADGVPGAPDPGVGPVPVTPIMRWLAELGGETDEFNQTMVLRAPAAAEADAADVVAVLQALLDHHAMLRLRADDGAGGWALTVPETGAVDARDCLLTVDELTDAAVLCARARLDPAAGRMVSALWAPRTAELALVVHHLVVDGVSWRILLEDLNVAWIQHRGGQPIALAPVGTSFQRWAHLLDTHADLPEVGEHASTWQRILDTPALLAAPDPVSDTYAVAGHHTAELDTETTRRLLGAIPAAFHAGLQDILLIAYAQAWAELLGSGGAPIGIDVESHGRDDDVAPGLDLSRTVGWFTAKYPVALAVPPPGTPEALGRTVKAAKEQLRALPDGLSYGLLRYLRPESGVSGPDPVIGFNYLGRLGGAVPEAEPADGLWQVGTAAPDVARMAGATRIPLAHSVELNAGVLQTAAGPTLHADWTWATTAFDNARAERLSRLWFDALTAICAHVEQGGGGLTPSDIVPARLTQAQIDELQTDYQIADILPLSPLQHGLLYHATRLPDGSRGDTYALQLDLAVTGPLDAARLLEAIRVVVRRHPNLAARFVDRYEIPVQIIPADPEICWQQLEFSSDSIEEQIRQHCAAERAAVCDLRDGPSFRAAVVRTGEDRHRITLTSHHIVLDGWSLPILLGEIFAAYHHTQLPAAVPYRRFVQWLADRDTAAARAAWGEVFAGFERPTLVGPPTRATAGQRGVCTNQLSVEITGAARCKTSWGACSRPQRR